MNAIIHVDEIFLKGSNQPVFYRRLKSNLEKLLPGVRVARVEGGMWLENVQSTQLQQLSLIPGFANYAEAIKAKSTIEDIKKGVDDIVQLLSRASCGDEGSSLVIPNLIGNPDNRRLDSRFSGNDKPTFRISVERSFKNFPLSSGEIAKQIGEYARVKYNLRVSLNNPDLNIHISVGKTEACIYSNTQNCVGGLPTGTAGKVLAMLSGGIDSPVAAYKIMCRGGEADLIHFQNQTQVTEAVSEKIFDLAKVLSKYQPEIKLFIVPFADIQKQIIIKVPARYRMIVTRRIFNKIADIIARQNNYLALVSGDSLGQVASQTLENMAVIANASDLLKLAPLIGTNKKDIIDLARKIGTMDISSRPYEDCCSLFLAKHPETWAKLNDVLEYEKNLDFSALDKLPINSYHISHNSICPMR
jgi:tRNA uracil 4-sulfurtransferase